MKGRRGAQTLHRWIRVRQPGKWQPITLPDLLNVVAMAHPADKWVESTTYNVYSTAQFIEQFLIT